MSKEVDEVNYYLTKSFLFDLWLWKCGLEERNINARKPDLIELRRTEWDATFEHWFRKAVAYYDLGSSKKETDSYFYGFTEFMHNRLLMGAFRYGKLHDFNRTHYDYMSGILRYLKKYEDTGNSEMLIDVANYALIESVRGTGEDNYDFPVVHLLVGVEADIEDYLEAIRYTVRVYQGTKAKIHLACIASFAMFAAMNKVHPKHHFEGTDNVELHCHIKV